MNTRYHCISTLQFAQRPFFKKNILIEEPAVLTNLCFHLHNLLATGARPDPPPLHKEGGEEEEEEEDEKILKSNIKSIEEEIHKLCQGILILLRPQYNGTLFIIEPLSFDSLIVKA